MASKPTSGNFIQEAIAKQKAAPPATGKLSPTPSAPTATTAARLKSAGDGG